MLIGYLFAFFNRQGHANQEALLFMTVGVCGGFTTFSAFSHENLLLIRNGQLGLSCTYTIASVLSGIGAAWLGYSLVK
jgi:CrcB protein